MGFHFGHGICWNRICPKTIKTRPPPRLRGLSGFSFLGCWLLRRPDQDLNLTPIAWDALRGTIFVSRKCGQPQWASLWTHQQVRSPHNIQCPKIQWFAYSNGRNWPEGLQAPCGFLQCHILEQCHAAAQPVDNCLVKHTVPIKLMKPLIYGDFRCHAWLPDFCYFKCRFSFARLVYQRINPLRKQVSQSIEDSDLLCAFIMKFRSP